LSNAHKQFPKIISEKQYPIIILIFSVNAGSLINWDWIYFSNYENKSDIRGGMKSTYSKKSIFLSLGIFIALFLIIDLTRGYLDLKPMQKRYMEIRTQHHYYHHGLKPCKSSLFEEVVSGRGYPLTTNSLGFKDSSIRQVPLKVDKKRILFIGDSFTEGIFVPYESTFTGQIAKYRQDLDILNAGVSSYCPLTYYRKVDYLINKVNLKFNELFVFIDISDIQDEYVYNDLESYTPSMEASFLNDYFFEAKRFAYNLLEQIIKKHSEKIRIMGARGMWTLNQRFYDKYNINIREEDVRKWAVKGMAHAQENMQKLVNLCKKNNIPLTIVVYPWKAQIYAKDIPSKQETIWSSFAQKNGIGFLDLFPAFINNESPEIIFDKYFFPGDDHWNDSGHALVAKIVLDYMKEKEVLQN
jgi:lysophospholipase L1-like esterase